MSWENKSLTKRDALSILWAAYRSDIDKLASSQKQNNGLVLDSGLLHQANWCFKPLVLES